MEVHFNPEQEAALSQMAARYGTTIEDLLWDGVGRLLADRQQIEKIDTMLTEAYADPKFHKSVERGIEQADRGELISEEEMDVRFEQMLASLPS